MTPAGLASVVLGHLEGHRASRLRGGLTDMEDQRYVAVSMTLDGGENHLEVRVSDPHYLPGDRGPDGCEVDGGEAVPGGVHQQCHELPDGTVLSEYLLPAGTYGEGSSAGSAGFGYAEGPGRSVQVQFTSTADQPEIAWSELVAIVEDADVAWRTDRTHNEAGRSVGITVADRVAR